MTRRAARAQPHRLTQCQRGREAVPETVPTVLDPSRPARAISGMTHQLHVPGDQLAASETSAILAEASAHPVPNLAKWGEATSAVERIRRATRLASRVRPFRDLTYSPSPGGI